MRRRSDHNLGQPSFLSAAEASCGKGHRSRLNVINMRSVARRESIREWFTLRFGIWHKLKNSPFSVTLASGHAFLLKGLGPNRVCVLGADDIFDEICRIGFTESGTGSRNSPLNLTACDNAFGDLATFVEAVKVLDDFRLLRFSFGKHLILA